MKMAIPARFIPKKICGKNLKIAVHPIFCA
jgi:hypothetical protein